MSSIDDTKIMKIVNARVVDFAMNYVLHEGTDLEFKFLCWVPELMGDDLEVFQDLFAKKLKNKFCVCCCFAPKAENIWEIRVNENPDELNNV